MKTHTINKLIRQPEVSSLIGWSKTTLQTRIKKGLFPKSVSIGDRAIAWVLPEVEQVMDAMIAGKSKAEIENIVINIHLVREGNYCE